MRCTDVERATKGLANGQKRVSLLAFQPGGVGCCIRQGKLSKNKCNKNIHQNTATVKRVEERSVIIIQAEIFRSAFRKECDKTSAIKIA
jgi:hypothetical protein